MRLTQEMKEKVISSLREEGFYPGVPNSEKRRIFTRAFRRKAQELFEPMRGRLVTERALRAEAKRMGIDPLAADDWDPTKRRPVPRGQTLPPSIHRLRGAKYGLSPEERQAVKDRAEEIASKGRKTLGRTSKDVGLKRKYTTKRKRILSDGKYMKSLPVRLRKPMYALSRLGLGAGAAYGLYRLMRHYAKRSAQKAREHSYEYPVYNKVHKHSGFVNDQGFYETYDENGNLLFLLPEYGTRIEKGMEIEEAAALTLCKLVGSGLVE